MAVVQACCQAQNRWWRPVLARGCRLCAGLPWQQQERRDARRSVLLLGASKPQPTYTPRVPIDRLADALLNQHVEDGNSPITSAVTAAVQGQC